MLNHSTNPQVSTLRRKELTSYRKSVHFAPENVHFAPDFYSRFNLNRVFTLLRKNHPFDPEFTVHFHRLSLSTLRRIMHHW
ncbi:MAG: hypothetical protein IPH16_17245 [Haliscomenobacter sp.]|nr:hypothetical protein [Haliscomenobacter sp.]